MQVLKSSDPYKIEYWLIIKNLEITWLIWLKRKIKVLMSSRL